MSVFRASVDSGLLAALEHARVSLHWKSEKPRDLPQTLVMSASDSVEPYTGFFRGGSLCTMGAFSFSHSPVAPELTVGRYCAISWGLKVTGPKHPYEWLSTTNMMYDRNAANVQKYFADNPGAYALRRPVMLGPMPQIGHDVWIGQDVSINRGVTIGDGAIVAAYSVVTRNVPPYTIVGGNPATVIKQRFSDELCARLHQSEWWKYEAKDVLVLPADRVEEFLDEFEARKTMIAPYEPVPLQLGSLSPAESV